MNFEKEPAAPAASNTFYAIFGTGCRSYLKNSTCKYLEFSYGLRGETKNGAHEAKQFATMAEVLSYIQEEGDDLGPIEIRRITRSTTPGTTSRRILDHGEAAPAGATIKWAVENPYSARCLAQIDRVTGDVKSWGVTDIQDATLFASEYDAVVAVTTKAETNGSFFIRRVAITTTEGKVEYREEVVQ